MIWKIYYIFLIIFLLLLNNFSYAEEDATVNATTTIDTTISEADILRNKIDERNILIKHLEDEIKQYNKEVQDASTQAKTLQNTLKNLDLTKKKLSKDITLTETKISKTVFTIDELDGEINKAGKNIEVNKQAIISAIQSMDALEDIGLLQLLLSKNNLSDAWGDIDNVRQVRETLRDRTKELAILKTDMEKKQSTLKGEKKSLLNLKQDLSGKKQVVEYTTKEKTNLLTVTKNQEQTFKEIVKSKEEQKAQFEQEIYEYESQLNIFIDRSSYPSPKNGILQWPLDNIYITQKFGKTVGAEKLYTSGSHNGVDLRASIGTRVLNVLDGVVVGTGNTDQYPGCYSFGKWVMVKHNNGLSTIYGHLSVISVTTGSDISAGDLIGYSGNTGYSTGPHLHISVYASQGVRIEQYVNSRGCQKATIPLADIKAYLDPLAYFPSLE